MLASRMYFCLYDFFLLNCVIWNANSTFLDLEYAYTFNERSRRDRLQITVYFDVIFLINFIAGFMVLYLTGVIAKRKIILWKVVVAAVISASILLVFVLKPTLLMGFRGIVISIGISMGAVAIPYGERRLSFVRTWFLSTTIMVLIGGIMNYLKYIFHISVLQMLQWFLLFSASSVCILILIVNIQKTRKRNDNNYLIRITHGEKSIIEMVYMDTGNMLVDPLFQKPVLVLNEDVVNKCVIEEERLIIKQYRESGKLDYNCLLSGQTQKRVCFHEIAYQSVGNPSGKILCILLDEVNILGEGKVLYKQPVAIVPKELFKGKAYQGLLHRESI